MVRWLTLLLILCMGVNMGAQSIPPPIPIERALAFEVVGQQKDELDVVLELLADLEDKVDEIGQESKERDEMIMGGLAAVNQTVAVHAQEVREIKSWVQRWLVERVLPIVGGLLGGYAIK